MRKRKKIFIDGNMKLYIVKKSNRNLRKSKLKWKTRKRKNWLSECRKKRFDKNW